MSILRATHDDLRDLASGSPELVESRGGVPTGVKLVRYVGSSDMTVSFLAELDPARRSQQLASHTPQRLVVKMLSADVARGLSRGQMDPFSVYAMQASGIARAAERQPATPFILGFYGNGRIDVSVNGASPCTLPWIAVEHVDGEPAGATLFDRVRRAPDGVDPIRALRLLRGIAEAMRILNEERIHLRDPHPDDVHVAGAVDDETPKLDAYEAAWRNWEMFAGRIPVTGGMELLLASRGQANPLVGPWMDVHALASLAFYVIGGEPWCQSNVDRAFYFGERRSLATANRLHRAYVADPAELARLDTVLARGGSARLPEIAWSREGAAPLLSVARARYPSMFEGVPRYETIDAFAAELMPILERVASAWTRSERRDETHRTAPSPPPTGARGPAIARVRVTPPPALDAAIAPGSVLLQPDGKVLARLGDRLVYVVDGEPHDVGVPDAMREAVGASRWILRGPERGFAMVGPRHVIRIVAGKMFEIPFPSRARGGEVGAIQAVLGDVRMLTVVTTETDDGDGGPELWSSTDGTSWSAPMTLPLGGEANGIARSADGFLVVGARRGKGRALFVDVGGPITVITAGVNEKAALLVTVVSSARVGWAAGEGGVVRIEGGVAHVERCEIGGTPVSLALDEGGVPWLVTERAVARRHIDEGDDAIWRSYYTRSEGPALVAIGFTRDGARVLDAQGGLIAIEPTSVSESTSGNGNEAKQG